MGLIFYHRGMWRVIFAESIYQNESVVVEDCLYFRLYCRFYAHKTIQHKNLSEIISFEGILVNFCYKELNNLE